MNGLDVLYTACLNNQMRCAECPMFIYAIEHKIEPVQVDCKKLYELMVYGKTEEE